MNHQLEELTRQNTHSNDLFVNYLLTKNIELEQVLSESNEESGIIQNIRDNYNRKNIKLPTNREIKFVKKSDLQKYTNLSLDSKEKLMEDLVNSLTTPDSGDDSKEHEKLLLNTILLKQYDRPTPTYVGDPNKLKELENSMNKIDNIVRTNWTNVERMDTTDYSMIKNISITILSIGSALLVGYLLLPATAVTAAATAASAAAAAASTAASAVAVAQTAAAASIATGTPAAIAAAAAAADAAAAATAASAAAATIAADAASLVAIEAAAAVSTAKAAAATVSGIEAAAAATAAETAAAAAALSTLEATAATTAEAAAVALTAKNSAIALAIANGGTATSITNAISMLNKIKDTVNLAKYRETLMLKVYTIIESTKKGRNINESIELFLRTGSREAISFGVIYLMGESNSYLPERLIALKKHLPLVNTNFHVFGYILPVNKMFIYIQNEGIQLVMNQIEFFKASKLEKELERDEEQHRILLAEQQKMANITAQMNNEFEPASQVFERDYNYLKNNVNTFIHDNPVIASILIIVTASTLSKFIVDSCVIGSSNIIEDAINRLPLGTYITAVGMLNTDNIIAMINMILHPYIIKIIEDAIPLKKAIMEKLASYLNYSDSDTISFDKLLQNEITVRILTKNIIYYLTNVVVTVTQDDIIRKGITTDFIQKSKEMYDGMLPALRTIFDEFLKNPVGYPLDFLIAQAKNAFYITGNDPIADDTKAAEEKLQAEKNAAAEAISRTSIEERKESIQTEVENSKAAEHGARDALIAVQYYENEAKHNKAKADELLASSSKPGISKAELDALILEIKSEEDKAKKNAELAVLSLNNAKDEAKKAKESAEKAKAIFDSLPESEKGNLQLLLDNANKASAAADDYLRQAEVSNSLAQTYITLMNSIMKNILSIKSNLEAVNAASKAAASDAKKALVEAQAAKKKAEKAETERQGLERRRIEMEEKERLARQAAALLKLQREQEELRLKEEERLKIIEAQQFENQAKKKTDELIEANQKIEKLTKSAKEKNEYVKKVSKQIADLQAEAISEQDAKKAEEKYKELQELVKLKQQLSDTLKSSADDARQVAELAKTVSDLSKEVTAAASSAADISKRFPNALEYSRLASIYATQAALASVQAAAYSVEAQAAFAEATRTSTDLDALISTTLQNLKDYSTFHELDSTKRTEFSEKINQLESTIDRINKKRLEISEQIQRISEQIKTGKKWLTDNKDTSSSSKEQVNLQIQNWNQVLLQLNVIDAECKSRLSDYSISLQLAKNVLFSAFLKTNLAAFNQNYAALLGKSVIFLDNSLPTIDTSTYDSEIAKAKENYKKALEYQASVKSYNTLAEERNEKGKTQKVATISITLQEILDINPEEREQKLKIIESSTKLLQNMKDERDKVKQTIAKLKEIADTKDEKLKKIICVETPTKQSCVDIAKQNLADIESLYTGNYAQISRIIRELNNSQNNAQNLASLTTLNNEFKPKLDKLTILDKNNLTNYQNTINEWENYEKQNPENFKILTDLLNKNEISVSDFLSGVLKLPEKDRWTNTDKMIGEFKKGTAEINNLKKDRALLIKKLESLKDKADNIENTNVSVVGEEVRKLKEELEDLDSAISDLENNLDKDAGAFLNEIKNGKNGQAILTKLQAHVQTILNYYSTVLQRFDDEWFRLNDILEDKLRLFAHHANIEMGKKPAVPKPKRSDLRTPEVKPEERELTEMEMALQYQAQYRLGLLMQHRQTFQHMPEFKEVYDIKEGQALTPDVEAKINRAFRALNDKLHTGDPKVDNIVDTLLNDPEASTLELPSISRMQMAKHEFTIQGQGFLIKTLGSLALSYVDPTSAAYKEAMDLIEQAKKVGKGIDMAHDFSEKFKNFQEFVTFKNPNLNGYSRSFTRFIDKAHKTKKRVMLFFNGEGFEEKDASGKIKKTDPVIAASYGNFNIRNMLITSAYSPIMTKNFLSKLFGIITKPGIPLYDMPPEVAPRGADFISPTFGVMNKLDLAARKAGVLAHNAYARVMNGINTLTELQDETIGYSLGTPGMHTMLFGDNFNASLMDTVTQQEINDVLNSHDRENRWGSKRNAEALAVDPIKADQIRRVEAFMYYNADSLPNPDTYLGPNVPSKLQSMCKDKTITSNLSFLCTTIHTTKDCTSKLIGFDSYKFQRIWSVSTCGDRTYLSDPKWKDINGVNHIWKVHGRLTHQ